jgi:hypothetical protein
MIWVAWRQHRQQVLAGAAALAALTVFLLPTGLGISHTFRSSGLAHCLATPNTDCGGLGEAFDRLYNRYQFLVPLFLVAPVLIGMFWGAPLISREIENGTHRLAWTQGVSRRRWVTTKVGVLTLSAVVGTAAFAALVTWWSRPLVMAGTDRFDPGIFDLRGIVPIAYAVFAVLLGVAVGSVITKTLPAIGVTIAGFIAVRFAITAFLRQHYLPLKHAVYSFEGPRGGTARVADWIVSENTIDRSGRIVSRGGGLDFNYLAAHCPAVAAAGPFGVKGSGAVDSCVRSLGLRTAVAFQPAARFWTFQWIEFGVYIGLALGLAAFVIWRVKRLS